MSRAIATRSFTYKGNTVSVRLYAPERVGKEEWRCHFKMVGIQSKGPFEARGVDAFQALILALEQIGRLTKPQAERLTWRFGEKGELGFPLFVPSFFGPRFSKRLEAYIDREVRAFARAAKKKATARRQSRNAAKWHNDR